MCTYLYNRWLHFVLWEKCRSLAFILRFLNVYITDLYIYVGTTHLQVFFFKRAIFCHFLELVDGYPVIHFLSAYITSNLGPFLSPYMTFESNIRAHVLLWKYIQAQKWAQLAQCNIRTQKMYHWVLYLFYISVLKHFSWPLPRVEKILLYKMIGPSDLSKKC